MHRDADQIPNLFGSYVFNEEAMSQYVDEAAMNAWRACLRDGRPLTLDVAGAIADGMKVWALEHGATHFTHWFQPMTGFTAEKHDSFISPVGGGKICMEFSGKELVSGESDASSFPSGGLRATFEARGYTAWDPTAYAFIKDDSLYIPTVFCSYSGEALDKKTPLLRSISAVSRQAVRILRLFGDTETKKVTPQVGPEQEYFLVDKEMYLKREDLRLCGRTLFGAKPPKGQELDDHYYGSIRPRVAAFMRDLDEELWKLGVLSKTKHNEVAPAQHEMAPIYSDVNTACDQNQLTMEIMKKVADRHNLVCLLHEKPFAGVNGSGKHNNWSLATDTGKNLFAPGKTPSQSAQFLLFLTAFLEGVDNYQELLRSTVAFAGNDHRLGAQEAPPAIISVFLGSELEAIIQSILDETDYTDRKKGKLRIGVDVLPAIPQDTTDRNRTSPVAFTGNKFEFRMPGSSQSISGPNIALNALMAESLRRFADALEGAEDFDAALHTLIQDSLRAHHLQRQRLRPELGRGSGAPRPREPCVVCRCAARVRAGEKHRPAHAARHPDARGDVRAARDSHGKLLQGRPHRGGDAHRHRAAYAALRRHDLHEPPLHGHRAEAGRPAGRPVPRGKGAGRVGQPAERHTARPDGGAEDRAGYHARELYRRTAAALLPRRDLRPDAARPRDHRPYGDARRRGFLARADVL